MVGVGSIRVRVGTISIRVRIGSIGVRIAIRPGPIISRISKSWVSIGSNTSISIVGISISLGLSFSIGSSHKSSKEN